MKKVVSVVIIVLILHINMLIVHAGTNYTSQEAGLFIPIPADWVELDLVKERQIVKTKYQLRDGSIFIIGWYDMWSEMGGNSSGYTREAINNAILTKDDWLDIIHEFDRNSNYVGEQTINGVKYIKGMLESSVTVDGNLVNVKMITYYHIRNGFMYMFQYGSFRNENRIITGINAEQVESVLSGIEFSVPSSLIGNGDSNSAYSVDFNWWIILINLLITVIIYSLPIIIYRYAVKKSPVEPKKAKKISFVYAGAALVIMIFLAILMKSQDTAIGGGVLGLWSFINYRMLVSGKAVSQQGMENAYVSYDNSTIQGSAMFCNHCGHRINATSKFCTYCGKPVNER